NARETLSAEWTFAPRCSRTACINSRASASSSTTRRVRLASSDIRGGAPGAPEQVCASTNLASNVCRDQPPIARISQKMPSERVAHLASGWAAARTASLKHSCPISTHCDHRSRLRRTPRTPDKAQDHVDELSQRSDRELARRIDEPLAVALAREGHQV